MTAPEDSAPNADELDEAPSTGVPKPLMPGPETPHPVRVGEAIGFAFEGPHAKRNLAVASLWLLIPLAGWLAVQGWTSETARRLVERHPSPAPRLRLRDFPHYAARGGAAAFVGLLGAGLLGVLGVGLFFVWNAVALTVGMAASSWLVILLALLGALGVVVAILGLVTVLWNAMLTRVELNGRLGEALAIGAAWREARPVRGRTALSYFWFFWYSLFSLALGGVLCGVGILPAYVAVKLAGVHLRWQLYAERVHRGGKALPVREPAVLPSERKLVVRLPPAGGTGRQ